MTKPKKPPPPSARNWATLPAHALLSKREIAYLMNVSERTLERKVTTADFPQPTHPSGTRLVRWTYGDVLTYMRRQAPAAFEMHKAQFKLPL